MEILTEKEKRRIKGAFDEILSLQGFEYFYVAGMVFPYDKDLSFQDKLIMLSPEKGVLASDDFNKMMAAVQGSKTDFYRIIRKNISDLNKIGRLSADKSCIHEVIARQYITVFPGTDNETTEDLTIKSCMNLLIVWAAFYGDYELFMKFVNPINKRGEIISTGRKLPAYIIPNSYLMDVYYMFAFNAFTVAGVNIIDNISNAEIMKERLQSYKKNKNISGRIEIDIEPFVSAMQKSGSGEEIGIIKFIEKGRCGDVIIEKRVKNNENTFILGKTAGTYKKIFFFILEQHVNQSFVNDVQINLDDLVTRGIYRSVKRAFSGLYDFLEYQKTITVDKYNKGNIGTILFQYTDKPDRMPKDHIVIVTVSPIVSGSLTNKSATKRIGDFITVFPQWIYTFRNGDAIDIAHHICFTMRQNGENLQNNGYYTVSMQRLAEKIWLPVGQEAENLTKQSRAKAKSNLLEAIKEVNQKSNGEVDIEVNNNFDGVGYCEMLKTGSVKIRVAEQLSLKTIVGNPKRIEGRKKAEKHKKKLQQKNAETGV